MKIETTAGMLKTSLALVGRVLSRRCSVPILGAVLFDGAHVRATNLDIDITVPLIAKRAQGRAAIAYRPLVALVRALPDGEEVTLAGGEEGATLTFASGRYDLPVYPASDFPELDAFEWADIAIDGDRLKRALGFVAGCVSREETRYYFNGVFLDADRVVATNGHLLGVHPHGATVAAEQQCILPSGLVALLLSLPVAARFSLAPNRHRCRVEAGGAVVVAKLIDGTFPDWRRVVPGHNSLTGRLSFKPKDMLAAIRRISGMMGEGSPAVTLAFHDSGLAACAKGMLGTAREYLGGAEAHGLESAAALAFNGQYLKFVSGSLLGGDRVEAHLSADGGPVIFQRAQDRQPEEEEPFIVLMPMRVRQDELAIETLTEWSAREARVAA